MHDGIIADRYAKAFLEYTDSHGVSQTVTDQVRTILSAMGALPKFRDAVTVAVDVPFEDKLSLLQSAVAPGTLDPSLVRLYSLMNVNNRLEQFRMTLLDYLVLYRKQQGIRMVMVTSADSNEAVVEAASRIAEKEFGRKVVPVHRVDPELVGGFIIDSWGWRLDASVRGALEKLDSRLKDKNIRKV